MRPTHSIFILRNDMNYPPLLLLPRIDLGCGSTPGLITMYYVPGKSNLVMYALRMRFGNTLFS